MALAADDYRQQLLALLPPGPAWDEDFEPFHGQLLGAFGDGLAGVHERADALRRELDPQRPYELLARWEGLAGLPDKCAGTLEQTLQGRRQALVSKLLGLGGQSAAYFIAVAAALGYAVTITTYRPFRAGASVAGEALTNGAWVYAWRVNAAEVTAIPFRAGASVAGEPLKVWGNDTLECKINQLKPAHTVAQFAYFTPLAAPASLSVEYVA